MFRAESIQSPPGSLLVSTYSFGYSGIGCGYSGIGCGYSGICCGLSGIGFGYSGIDLVILVLVVAIS